MVLDQAVDVTLEGCRVKKRLMLIPDFGEDGPNVGHESHIGHAVGLVDYHHLDVSESDRSSLQEVEQTSWTGDSNVDSPLERTELLAETDSSIEGGDA